MNSQQFFVLLRDKFWIIALFGLLFSAVSFFGLMFLEKPFQSRMDFLVVQTSAQTQDFYSLFKSSEYLGKVLSEAIYSERFIDAVIETGKVNAEFLPLGKKERLQAWSEMVAVRKNLELGIIGVTVNGESERDVARVMNGIALVLTQKNTLFRGGDEKSVEIRILSGPIGEQSPTPGKIVKVVGAGFLAGILLTAFWLIIRAETASYKNREKEVSLDDVLV